MIKQRDKSKIIQIWGDILDYGFTSVPNILLRYRSNLGIKSQHLTLIIDIMSFKWDSESPFPSYSTLARRAGVDERSIKRITQDLEELSLLIKTPRFDDETGAQITTIFDFRPLVKKLIEEMNQTTFNAESLIATNKTISKKEGDKFITGGGDKFVTGGVTNNSLGGVTNLSPKEDSYNKKTHIKKNNSTLKVHKTENQASPSDKTSNARKNKKWGAYNYFRNGIFRERLFEIYDNLYDVKTIQDLVEEGAYKACKELILSKIDYYPFKYRTEISPEVIAKEVRLKFPYHKMPRSYALSRNFFVASICNLTSETIYSLLNGS